MKKQLIFWIFLSVILSANEENFINISIMKIFLLI
jgi:hypothetical protein